jgi:hypothetical protein
MDTRQNCFVLVTLVDGQIPETPSYQIHLGKYGERAEFVLSLTLGAEFGASRHQSVGTSLDSVQCSASGLPGMHSAFLEIGEHSIIGVCAEFDSESDVEYHVIQCLS